MSRKQYGDSLDLDTYREAVADAREDLGLGVDHRSDGSESENTVENQHEGDDATLDEDGDPEEEAFDESEVAAAVANAELED
jgi:hypothetical protein